MRTELHDYDSAWSASEQHPVSGHNGHDRVGKTDRVILCCNGYDNSVCEWSHSPNFLSYIILWGHYEGDGWIRA